MKSAKTGVLARALTKQSQFVERIEHGRQAMGSYSTLVTEVNLVVSDSIDFDESTRSTAPQEPRWDYILGAAEGRHIGAKGRRRDCIVGIEVHSATDGEVAVVIAKKRASQPRLAAELRPDAPPQRWVWIASGRVKFSPNSSYRRRLAMARIEFAGRKLSL